jgi:hypothetical protein
MTTTEIIPTSQRGFALAAGSALLLMALLAGFSYGYVYNNLFVSGNAAATAANIRASEGLFRLGIFAFVGVLVLDIVAAWGLYYVLQPVNKSLSLLAALLRLVYAAIFGVAFLNLILITQIASGASYLSVRTYEKEVFLGQGVETPCYVSLYVTMGFSPLPYFFS